MSKPLPSSPPNSAVSSGAAPPKTKPRRRWIRWLLAVVVLLALFVVFLPNLLALPFLRQWFLDLGFSRLNTKATVGDLSLSWFSPVVIDDLKLQPENTDRAALSVQRIDSDASLLRLLFGHNLGKFSISKPELYIHFDKEGTNITRLVRGLASMSVGNRASELKIANGTLLLQGESSPQPSEVNGINLNLTLTPAAENAAGVPSISGEKALLLDEVELTPEMCNDLLKYITPALFQATSTSGKISLELENFNWPLGKPNAANLKGTLTLHSVDVVPGPLMQLVSTVIQNQDKPMVMDIAKDDVVNFKMHDGRVYHDNLTFLLSALQLEIQVHSHGSVGLDETLDWYVELEFPKLQGADLTGHPFMKLLSDKPTLHIVGTFSQPKLSPEGLGSQALKAGMDFLQQKREQRDQQPGRPRLLPGRRPSDNNAVPSK